MRLLNKISKAFSLCRDINVWQTLKLYYSQPHPRSAELHICNKSQIYIAPTAKIEMKPNSIFEFNMMEDPFRKVRPSRLILKDNSRLVCKGHIQTFEAVKIECLPNAVVEIGDKSYINHDSEIRCRERITIGNNVSIAYNVLIQDSDYHTTYDDNGNHKPQTLPIMIEDNVWIAPNSSIRGFLHLGEGCVVGMGAVVTKDIPAKEIWVGNPAQKIRKI